MAKVTQFCVGLANTPGTLAKLCGATITDEVRQGIAALPEGDKDGLGTFGIDFAVRQCTELLEAGLILGSNLSVAAAIPAVRFPTSRATCRAAAHLPGYWGRCCLVEVASVESDQAEQPAAL